MLHQAAIEEGLVFFIVEELARRRDVRVCKGVSKQIE
jgi:hypothetical protein